MAYIGQGIKQGTFKVLDTSGNTYNGSNTTFSLGTQVGAAAQLLVSHDGVIQLPGTDYTLASGGTQITFSTAPASGASIFIIEISGAVGGTVTPSDNSVGITQLNVSDGSNGQALTTNGSGTLSFSTISTGLTGIDDQSSSNDDQVTITDTAVVINEDSDDVDFRVESNGNANMLVVNGGGDRVGIGADPDLGVGLHVKTADAGGGSIDGNGDEVVLEGSDHIGITMLVPNDKKGNIYFADTDSSAPGVLRYDHNDNSMQFIVNGNEAFRLTSDRDLNFGSGQLQLLFDNSAATATAQWDRGAGQGGNNSTALEFKHGGSTKGSVTYNDGSTSYNTSSDYRLKENAVAISDGITRLKTLKPYRFNFKTNVNKTVDGFFAHEVTAVPEAITGEKDATETYTDENGEEQTRIAPQSIDQSKLVPLLTAALQEAITEIESLKARVTTLEG